MTFEGGGGGGHVTRVAYLHADNVVVAYLPGGPLGQVTWGQVGRGLAWPGVACWRAVWERYQSMNKVCPACGTPNWAYLARLGSACLCRSLPLLPQQGGWYGPDKRRQRLASSWPRWPPALPQPRRCITRPRSLLHFGGKGSCR